LNDFGFVLAGSGSGVPMLSIQRLRCELNPWSIVSGPIEPTRLAIEGLALRAERGSDGRLNLEKMLKPKGAGSPPPEGMQLFQDGPGRPCWRASISPDRF